MPLLGLVLGLEGKDFGWFRIQGFGLRMQGLGDWILG